MTRRRNIFSSININNSQKLDPSQITIKMNRDIPTKNDEENSESEDCFIKYKYVPFLEEKTSKTEIQQPANLVEHINAITTLIIYHTYSKQHKSAKSCE